MKYEALQVFREERKNFCRGNRAKFMRTWHLVKPPWTQEVWHAEREGDEAEAGDDQRSGGRDATACGMHTDAPGLVRKDEGRELGEAGRRGQIWREMRPLNGRPKK